MTPAKPTPKLPGAPHLSCEEIARAALGEPAKREGRELLWHCSRHEDKHASLSINVKKDVWACFPCGASGTAWQLAAFLAKLDPGDKPAVTAWLREHGLLVKRDRKAKRAHGPCVATYIYTDAEGKALARKRRFEPGADGRRKDFVLERSENGTWKAGTNGLSLPLYRQHNITNEPLVILVEGEKDANAGAKLGLATTTAGGVNSFRSDHAESLRGKQVVIVADADEPGRRDALRIAGLLHGNVASLKVVEIPEAKDLAEAIARDWTYERLLVLFDGAPEWKPTEGAGVLRDTERFISRYVFLPPRASLAIAAWIFGTFCFETFDVFPYLGVSSPLPRCGKSTLLAVISMLSRNAIPVANISEAAIFRTIEETKPVLLLDEIEWIRGDSERAQMLRNLLNAGHRCDAVVIRCEKTGERKTFSVYCPKALSAIGELNETLADRSIRVLLQRKTPSEQIERFRFARVRAEAAPIKQRIQDWVQRNRSPIKEVYDGLPDLAFLDDRAADNWSPLFSLIATADATRLAALREGALALSRDREDFAADDSLPLRLLLDFAQVAERMVDEVVPSKALIGESKNLEGSPWSSDEVRLTPRKAARWLRAFGLTPTRTRDVRGYSRVQLLSVAGRYRPREAETIRVESQADNPSQASPGVTPNPFNSLRVTDVTNVTDGVVPGGAGV